MQLQGVEDGMKMRYLPNTDLLVSELCLGTMMYGDQIKKSDALELLNIATKECGINFIVSEITNIFLYIIDYLLY